MDSTSSSCMTFSVELPRKLLGRLGNICNPSLHATAYVPALPTANDVLILIFSSSSSSSMSSIEPRDLRSGIDGPVAMFATLLLPTTTVPPARSVFGTITASSLSPLRLGDSLYFCLASFDANSVACIKDSKTTFLGNASRRFMGGCGGGSGSL